MDVMIVRVTDKSHVERLWPTVAPLLALAVGLSNGCYEMDDVLADLMGGKQELWVALDEDRVVAAMTTMFDQYPRKKTLKVVFIGGKKMKKWLAEFRELVEFHAWQNGASMIEGFFREGWVRVWPGARISGVGLVKDL